MRNFKIISIFILSLLLLVSCESWDEKISQNSNKNKENCFVFDADRQSIISYRFDKKECGKHVVIPEQIGGIDVLDIEERAFTNPHFGSMYKVIEGLMNKNNCKKEQDCMDLVNQEMQKFWKNYKTIESVVFPKTISNIWYYSFMGNNLKNISFPDNLLRIYGSAFKFTSLKEVVIPEITEYNEESFNSDVIIKTRKLDSLDMSEIAKKQRDKIRKNDIQRISISLENSYHYDYDKGTNPNSLDELENYIKDIPKEKFLNGKTINGCTFGYRYKKISNDEYEIRSCMESEEEFVHNSRS